MHKVRVTSTDGFTLVEMMVVVALIGILASLASSMYDSFSDRARTTEAKLALAAIYLAETSFRTEYSSYTGCLANIGYSPETNSRYFATGFGLVGSYCGPNGNSDCGQVDWDMGGRACIKDPKMVGIFTTSYPATLSMSGNGDPPPSQVELQSAGFFVTTGTFWAGAISNNPVVTASADRPEGATLYASLDPIPNAEAAARIRTKCHGVSGWSIDQNKSIQMFQGSVAGSGCPINPGQTPPPWVPSP